MSGNIFVVTTGVGMLLACSGYKPGMPLDILQRTGQPPLQRIISPQMPSAETEKPVLDS